MNAVFSAIVLVAALIFLVRDPNGFLPACLEGGERAATLSLGLLAIYCVWLGFFRVLEESGLAAKFSSRLYPFAKRLFRSDDKEALFAACGNLSANVLGLPGAPTPMGVAATQKFLAAKNDYAAEMLFVLNATSLQLLPTTVIALRLSAGAKTPADILLPTLLATLASTFVGALLVFLFRRKR